MKNLRRIALASLLSTAALEAPAVAGQLNDGLAALDRLDFSAALAALEPLANQGNVEAQVRVGHMYRNGLGAPVNYAKALKLYRSAADQNDARAQFELGKLSADCQGMNVNQSEMFKLLLRSGEQGYREAQDVLGYMYAYGVSVPADNVNAYLWYDLAAGQGGKDDAEKRELISKKMTPEQIAEAQQLAREWKPK